MTGDTMTFYECSECGGVALTGVSSARGAPYCPAHPGAAVESYSVPVETPRPADQAETYTVTLSDCYAPYRMRESRHRGTPGQALARAIRRHWGARADWHPDSGLGVSYGQVTTPTREAYSHRCVTGRVRLEVVRESDGADVTGRAYRQMYEAE